MKRCLLLALCLLLLTGCAQSYDGPMEEKRVLLREEHASFSGDTRRITHTSEYQYDLYGNQVLIGVGNSSVKITYDDQGRQIRCTNGSIPFFSTRQSYTYDDQGRLLTETYRPVRFWYGYTYTYQYEERKQTMTLTNWLGMVRYTEETYYDAAGNTLRQVLNEWEYHYTYDDQGHMLTARSYWNGEPETLNEYTYDDQGRLIQDVCTTLSRASATEITRVEYDDVQGTVTTTTGTDRTVEYYNEFGERYRISTYKDDELTLETLFHYGTIQVAAKEETP